MPEIVSGAARGIRTPDPVITKHEIVNLPVSQQFDGVHQNAREDKTPRDQNLRQKEYASVKHAEIVCGEEVS